MPSFIFQVKNFALRRNRLDRFLVMSSNSFSRRKSKYRGVVRHTNSGKWQARKGPGKDSFLGTFETEEEAAIAFDIASIKLKGFKAITNFDLNSYDVKAILEDKPGAKRLLNLAFQSYNQTHNNPVSDFSFLNLNLYPTNNADLFKEEELNAFWFCHLNSSCFKPY
ncbi:hypothetical protein UlMin_005245 [Ulmus minor]